MQSPANKCPFRSPQAVSEAIKDLIQDKVVCELGCAEGDNLVFMSRYAKQVIGFEYMQRRYQVAQQRGLDIIVGDYYKDDLPEAEVYYFWPDDCEHDSEYLTQKILSKPGFTGTIIVGGDTGFPSEIPALKRCANLGDFLEVPYNEGSGHREHGIFNLAIIDASQIKKRCVWLLSAPRCGSSCSAACFHLCGLSLGKTPTQVKDTFNQKGYFENATLLRFNEKVLGHIGSSIFTRNPLTEHQNELSLHFMAELEQIISNEFAKERFFLIKDPRITILQELYARVLQNLNIDISIAVVRRNRNYSAKSMNRMAGIQLQNALETFDFHYGAIEQLIKIYPSTQFTFEDLLQNPNEVMEKACKELDILYGIGKHQKTTIQEFVDKKLCNYK